MRSVLADRFVVAVRLLLGAVGVERRGRIVRGLFVWSTRLSSGRSYVNELKSPGKPFDISKWEVWVTSGMMPLAYTTLFVPSVA